MPDVREFQSVVDEAERAAGAGDFALADRRLRDALDLQEASLGATHPDLALTLNNLAVVCETLGQFTDAERFYRRAYAIASSALAPGDRLVVTSRDNLKDFCFARGLPLEDWPELDEFAPQPSPPPPPATPPVPARSAVESRAPVAHTAGAQPPASRWSGRVLGAVAAVAAIGAFVAVSSWREVTPAGPAATAALPSTAAPAEPAAAQPAVITAPPRAVPPAEPAVVAPAPATPVATPQETTPQVTTPPAGLRIVVADVCAALSTNGAWRCDPLGATPAPGRASFYTRIASPRQVRVQHRWYQGTALRQSVTLSIGANPSAGYRTFSRQTLTPGAWRVELRAADGALLHEAAFDVR